jgi:ribosomal protein L6, bacterial type
MSRIGRLPIKLSPKVTVAYAGGEVTVKGPLGTIVKPIENPHIDVKVDKGIVHVERQGDEKEIKAAHGLYRALINNMVIGVEKGFEKGLVISGVGYKAVKQGDKVVLSVGFSHTVELPQEAGIKVDVVSPTELSVKGIDKVLVGQYAANIRSVRKPEPYHGYGIRYKDEVIVRKAGKAAGK